MTLPTPDGFELISSKEIVTLLIEGGITGSYEIKYIDDTLYTEWLIKAMQIFTEPILFEP